MTAQATDHPRLQRQRSYRNAMVLLVVAGAGLLWAAASVWVTATATPAGLPEVTLSATGQQILPVVSGGGILALAGIAGTWATKGRWRTVVGAVLAAVLAWVAVSIIRFAVGLPTSVENSLARSEGIAATDLVAVQVSQWWVLALGAAAVGLLAAALITVRGARWSGMGDRYARSSATGTTMTSAQLWDALDRGEDPTIDPEVTQ
jgi:hypothetical protein